MRKCAAPTAPKEVHGPSATAFSCHGDTTAHLACMSVRLNLRLPTGDNAFVEVNTWGELATIINNALEGKQWLMLHQKQDALPQSFDRPQSDDTPLSDLFKSGDTVIAMFDYEGVELPPVTKAEDWPMEPWHAKVAG